MPKVTTILALLGATIWLLPACSQRDSSIGGFGIVAITPELSGNLNKAVVAAKPGYIGFEAIDEDKKTEEFTVLSGDALRSERSVPITSGELPLLIMDNDSLLIRVVGKQLHSGSTVVLDNGAKRSELRTESYPISSAGRIRRVYLLDPSGPTLTAISQLKRQATVESGSQNPVQLDNVSCAGYGYVGGALSYYVLSGSKLRCFGSKGTETIVIADLDQVARSIIKEVDAGTSIERIAFAESFAVAWTGSEYLIVGPDQVDRIPGIDVITNDPKGKARPKAQRLAFEQKPGALRFEGRMQPADRIGVDAFLLPFDSNTVAIVDKWYQRVHLVRKR